MVAVAGLTLRVGRARPPAAVTTSSTRFTGGGVRARSYARAVPVWASVLVAVIAVFASGGLGAWLGAWNDRHERFRDRMIAAADEFVGDAANALIALRNAIGEVRNAADPARVKKTVDLAWTTRDAVLRRSARIDLLFGPGSETGHAASSLVHDLAEACERLQPTRFDADGAEATLLEVTARLQNFQHAAFDGIRRAAPPSATVRESLRRPLPRP